MLASKADYKEFSKIIGFVSPLASVRCGKKTQKAGFSAAWFFTLENIKNVNPVFSFYIWRNRGREAELAQGQLLKELSRLPYTDFTSRLCCL